MTVGALLITIIVFGLLLWLVNSFVPMDQKVKTIFNVVMIIVLILWILKGFGLFSIFNTHV
jgi:hypothetical protein